MEMAGFDTAKSSAIIASLPIMALNFVGSTIAVFFVDKLGRRGILLWSIPGVFISLFGIGACFGLMEFQDFAWGKWGIIIFNSQRRFNNSDILLLEKIF